jgi:putative NADH-flavin reductase
MKIVVFGANGHVGSLVVKEALKRGHKVRAFVHSGSSFDYNPSLEIFKGDIYNNDDVSQAIKDVDAVVSALGSWSTPKKDILTAGMINIIPAMHKNNVKRVVSLTGSDAIASRDSKSLIHTLSHPFLSIVASKILKDAETHIKLLDGTDLNWTIVRSPIMNNRGKINKFRLTNKRPKPWNTINRNSVALCMVNLAESSEGVKQALYIARK